MPYLHEAPDVRALFAAGAFLDDLTRIHPTDCSTVRSRSGP